MPTYRNATVDDIVVGSYRFPAKSDLAIQTYVEGALPTGLTLVSDLPNNTALVLLSTKYTLKSGATQANITVPASITGAYRMVFYVESGEFRVNFNAVATAIVDVLITEGETWERKFYTRMADFISIYCVTGGTIYLSIYKA